VNRIVTDPSGFSVVVEYSSFRTGSTRTGKPQTSVGRVNGSACANCHLGPRADAVDAGTTTISRAIAAADTNRLISVRTSFRGHGVCSSSAEPFHGGATASNRPIAGSVGPQADLH